MYFSAYKSQLYFTNCNIIKSSKHYMPDIKSTVISHDIKLTTQQRKLT